MKVAFSVLTYRPSFIADEKINVGILFHNIEYKEVYFETTTNWTRVKTFDDEIDIDIFKMIINGMKSHAQRNLKDIHLENYIKRYNNELKFGKVFYKNVDSIKDFILETKQMFMPYDFEKGNRPTEQRQISYIKGLLKDSDIKYNTKAIKGSFNENINYDYTIGNYGFKLFEFQNKKVSRLIATAKHWSYNANEIRDIYKTIFIYDLKLEDEIFKTILKILSSSGAQVMSKEDVLEFTVQLKMKQNKVEQLKLEI
ncbi:hypothetical protein KW95_20365 [Clostridioides difficile]|uniref:DUF3037 domain-containing protein n=1 Tax=Clostridioides sp. ES-S-0048-02 TaxID=2770777 RepID=UPI0006CC904B|nr:hypothetical protein KW95_20365 [Clostridioides difficile]MCC0697756.1 DUF3037 domain-containing protein [Clostridioides sp. ES-S-0048-02]